MTLFYFYIAYVGDWLDRPHVRRIVQGLFWLVVATFLILTPYVVGGLLGLSGF